MNPTTGQAERQYYLDWLRVLIILFVFLYHVGLIFAGTWIVRAEQSSFLVGQALEFTAFLRMPALFFVAGAGTFFLLRRRSINHFLTERFRRLAIPFAAALLLLVPIQNFVVAKHQDLAPSGIIPAGIAVFDDLFPAIHMGWGHLWFIAYLALFSVASVPLLAYIRSSRGKTRLASIARISNPKLGIFLLSVPIIAIEVGLRWRWPGDINLVNDLAQVALFFTLFIYGFMLVGSSRFWDAVSRTLPVSISISALLCVLLPIIRLRSDRSEWSVIGLEHLSFQVAMGVLGWTSLLAILGLSRRYLNRDGRLLRYSSEASYPFYLIHHTVVIVVAFVVIGMHWNLLASLLVIAGVSFVVTVALYHLVVRRFFITRIMFGLKTPPSGAGSTQLQEHRRIPQLSPRPGRS